MDSTPRPGNTARSRAISAALPVPGGSLGGVIDHVTIRVSDLDEGRRFYSQLFELLAYPGSPAEGGGFIEWTDFSITQESPQHAAARGLHVGFYAESPAAVDAWWQALTAAGYQSDGAPGPRTAYGPEYYGAFVLDPAGNSAEAVNNGPRRQPGVIDHLWLRVRSLDQASRFYETVCPTVGHTVERLPERTQVRGSGATFSLVEGSPTENLHLAFQAFDRQAVDAFHQAGVQAGYLSNGAPGERPEYHPGYYAAFLNDPDGNNIEAVDHNRAIGVA
jgi:catechol 2,3-dioxygenase-like lactoylglutathione lyase family enzyme